MRTAYTVKDSRLFILENLYFVSKQSIELGGAYNRYNVSYSILFV